MQINKNYFKEILEENNVPTTKKELQKHWDKINENQGHQITNNSSVSPFWRLISAIVTAPSKKLIEFLYIHVLPNNYLISAKNKFLDILAWGFNIERFDAVFMQGKLTFLRTDITKPATIKKGTIVQSIVFNNQVYKMQTQEDAEFLDEKPTLEVNATALESGSSANLPPNYYSVLPSPIENIKGVTNQENYITQTGIDKESDNDLRIRCQNQFAASSNFHVDAAYKLIISDFARLNPKFMFFESNAPRGPGTANIYLMTQNGIISKDEVDAINAHIRDEGNHGNGDDVCCFALPSLPIDLKFTLDFFSNIQNKQKVEIINEVILIIKSAFRENNLYQVSKTFAQDSFSFSRLSAQIHPRFINEIKSINFKNKDIVSALELPVLRSINHIENA